ncbi:MAG: NAD(P)/FAD-dependent oxidoreductase, partial [Nitrospiria bacterium]
MHYDVIVAGAGPAGASAATRLARQNCSVLLLEKGRHPRHKSCGGGLSARLLPYLDPDVQRVIENEITTVSIRYREKKVSFSS